MLSIKAVPPCNIMQQVLPSNTFQGIRRHVPNFSIGNYLSAAGILWGRTAAFVLGLVTLGGCFHCNFWSTWSVCAPIFNFVVIVVCSLTFSFGRRSWLGRGQGEAGTLLCNSVHAPLKRKNEGVKQGGYRVFPHQKAPLRACVPLETGQLTDWRQKAFMTKCP